MLSTASLYFFKRLRKKLLGRKSKVYETDAKGRLGFKKPSVEEQLQAAIELMINAAPNRLPAKLQQAYQNHRRIGLASPEPLGVNDPDKVSIPNNNYIEMTVTAESFDTIDIPQVHVL